LVTLYERYYFDYNYPFLAFQLLKILYFLKGLRNSFFLILLHKRVSYCVMRFGYFPLRRGIYQESLETFLCNSRIKIFRRSLVTFSSKDFEIKVFRRGLITFPSKDFGIKIFRRGLVISLSKRILESRILEKV